VPGSAALDAILTDPSVPFMYLVPWNTLGVNRGKTVPSLVHLLVHETGAGKLHQLA